MQTRHSHASLLDNDDLTAQDMETPKSKRSTPLATPVSQTPNRLGALSPSANSTPGRNTALGLRVSKILSSSYKDEETCNALDQLAQFDLTDLADEYKSRSAGSSVAGATAGVNLKRQAEQAATH